MEFLLCLVDLQIIRSDLWAHLIFVPEVDIFGDREEKTYFSTFSLKSLSHGIMSWEKQINTLLTFSFNFFWVLFCFLSSLDMPIWVCLHSISLCHLHLNLYKLKAKFYLVMLLWSRSLKFLGYGRSHWRRKTPNQLKYLVNIFQKKNLSNSSLLGLGEC